MDEKNDAVHLVNYYAFNPPTIRYFPSSLLIPNPKSEVVPSTFNSRAAMKSVLMPKTKNTTTLPMPS